VAPITPFRPPVSAKEVLGRDRLRAEERLAKALDIEAKAEKALDEAFCNHESNMTAGTAQVLRTCMEAYHKARQQVRELTADVQKAQYERLDAAKWRKQREQLLSDLKSQYDGRGIHYELQCELLADTIIMIRQMQESGRDVPTDEFRQLVTQANQITDSLRRYTESTKTEVIAQQVQMACIALLERVVEPLAPPELFEKIVERARLMLESGDDAA
jgi:hypothetical protein